MAQINKESELKSADAKKKKKKPVAKTTAKSLKVQAEGCRDWPSFP